MRNWKFELIKELKREVIQRYDYGISEKESDRMSSNIIAFFKDL
jgi:hypothetical protein